MPQSIPFNNFPNVLNLLIADYFSFDDLNKMIESSDTSPELFSYAMLSMKNQYPQYIDLQREKANGNYPKLILYLEKYIFPAINFFEIPACTIHNKASFDELCLSASDRLKTMIDKDFYRQKVIDDINPLFVRDCVFFFCQNNAETAGELLNEHMWRSWKTFISDFLINYGADVTCINKKNEYPTLFSALRWGCHIDTLQRLINAGTTYDSFKLIKDNVEYNYLLIAALSGYVEAASLVAQKFPQSVSESLNTLKTMLDSNLAYSSEFGDYEVYEKDHLKKTHYTREEIEKAKVIIESLQIKKSPSYKRLHQTLFPPKVETTNTTTTEEQQSKRIRF